MKKLASQRRPSASSTASMPAAPRCTRTTSPCTWRTPRSSAFCCSSMASLPVSSW
jgi:hypothetical protein